MVDINTMYYINYTKYFLPSLSGVIRIRLAVTTNTIERSFPFSEIRTFQQVQRVQEFMQCYTGALNYTSFSSLLTNSSMTYNTICNMNMWRNINRKFMLFIDHCLFRNHPKISSFMGGLQSVLFCSCFFIRSTGINNQMIIMNTINSELN